MDYYPAEVATPPLALVALLGCPGLHGIVGEFLRAAHKPPINSLGIGDPAMAARIFGEKKASMTAPSGPLNILKADWFVKHRQQRPAVAAVFFEREAVVGDPNQWARVLAGLEAVRQATRPRGARMLLVIVSHLPAGPPTELPEDRIAALTRQAGIERRWITYMGTGEGEGALRQLGRALYEAAGTFYADDARRRLAVHAERRNPAPAVSVRVAFKAAALAEFRADWATAVKTYQAAYAELGRVEAIGPLPLQRWTELTAVAELIHLKVVTLLLHQQSVGEALVQFSAHISRHRRPPLPPPPAAAAAHAAWLVRQHSVMGELLSQRVDSGLLPPQREAQPAHFFLGAAHAAVERRRAAQRARELRPVGGAAEGTPRAVPGQYVGQFLAADGQRRLSEEEFLHFLEVSKIGAGDDLSAAALAKLKAAHELVMSSAGGGNSARQTRLAYHIGALMAREQLVAKDPAAARRLLLSVAGIYRREGWDVPLGAALLELRECAARLKLPEEHVRYSLELSALRHSLDQPQREAIAKTAVATLCSATAPLGSSSAASGTSYAGKEQSATGAALEFHMRPVNYGLLNTLALWCGFRPMPEADESPGDSPAAPEGTAQFGVAIWSNIPADLPAASIEVRVEEAGGRAFRVPARVRTPPETGASTGAPQDCAGDPVLIRLGMWTRVWAEWQPAAGGRARVTEVILNLGPHAAIMWSLGAFPPGAVPIGHMSPCLEDSRPPFAPGAVLAGTYELVLPPAHVPPLLEVSTLEMAVVGEQPSLDIAVSVGSTLVRPVLSVAASYADAGLPPELSLPCADSPTGAAETQASNSVTVSMGDSVSEQVRQRLSIRLPRPGQATLSVRLNYQTQHAGGEAAQVGVSAGIAAVDPFQLRLVCSAPARCCSLILADPDATELDGSSAVPGMLPVGQPCPAQASLASLAPCDIMLHDISVEAPQNTGEAPGVSISAAVPAASAESPVLLRKGDVHSVVARVSSQRPGRGVPSGHLAVTWRRSRPPGVQTVSSSSSRKGAAKEQSGAGPPAAAAVEVPPAVVTRVPLPAQDWGSPVLEAAAEWPPAVAAGAPFELRLRLRNRTAHLLEIGSRLGDTSGFVLAGTRAGSVSALPYQEALLRYQLIAVASGSLLLPEVHLSAARWAAQLQPLAGRRVFVLPAAPAAPPMAVAPVAPADALASGFAQLST